MSSVLLIVLGLLAPPGPPKQVAPPKAPPPLVKPAQRQRQADYKPLVTPAPQRHAAHRHYHHRHGHAFRHGYYYRGWEHRHWTRIYWDSRYSCHLYLCPATQAWYYWNADYYCYFPVTYVPAGSGYVFRHQARPHRPQAVRPLPPVDREGSR